MFDNELLADLRVRKGLTQQQLAEKMGVHRTLIVRWESGQVFPSMENIKKLSKIFHIKIDIFFNK